MSENIINKDNNKQMTTRERQHIEVAKLEAELNALKVDAFAKVRVVVVFLLLLTLVVRFGIIVTMRSRRARSARCLLGFQRQQRTAKNPNNAFTSARAAAEE